MGSRPWLLVPSAFPASMNDALDLYRTAEADGVATTSDFTQQIEVAERCGEREVKSRLNRWLIQTEGKSGGAPCR